MTRVGAKSSILALLLACTSLLTACSYMSDFVIVNQSDQPIEVRYKVKKSTSEPLLVTGIPAIMGASELSAKGGQQWKQLTAAQYQLDQDTRTVTVRVGPNEALRVASLHDYGGHDDPGEFDHFPVVEIDVSGAGGEIKLVGQQARMSFSEVSRALYTLTYK